MGIALGCVVIGVGSGLVIGFRGAARSFRRWHKRHFNGQAT